LDEIIPVQELQERLSTHAPPGLEILEIRKIHPRAKAKVSRLGYRLQIPESQLADLPQRIASLLNQNEIWVERTKPRPRRLNLRPMVNQIQLLGNQLEMVFWATPTAGVRPEEILSFLSLQQVLDQGGVLERYLLELEDEINP
jgi:uncharacterized protein (DUF2344 family)